MVDGKMFNSESVVGSHLIDGEFQSDKYPTTPRGKVPLSVKDATAQDLLWKYAQRRRSVDAQFSDDLESALRTAGYAPGAGGVHTLETIAGYQKRAEAAEADFATRDAEIGRLIEERNALRDALHRQNMRIEQMVTRDHVGECVEAAVASRDTEIATLRGAVEDVGHIFMLEDGDGPDEGVYIGDVIEKARALIIREGERDAEIARLRESFERQVEVLGDVVRAYVRAYKT